MPPDIGEIAERFRQSGYTLSTHSLVELDADSISRDALIDALGYDAPEVIEDRPGDARGASCLILAWMADGEPIHAVVAYWRSESLILVTAYRPDLEHFEADFKTRIR